MEWLLERFWNDPNNTQGACGATFNGLTDFMLATYETGMYGGFIQETGHLDKWRDNEFEHYNRYFMNRNNIFNQGMNFLVKSSVSENRIATNHQRTMQYVSVPVTWRNYYSFIGYHRNKATGELWLEPLIPDDMNHTLTDALVISPEGYATITCTESGAQNQNIEILFKPDKPIEVTCLYVRDRCGANAYATVTGAAQTVSRIGTGHAKEIKIPWTGTIDKNGILVKVGDDPQLVNSTRSLSVRPILRRSVESIAYDIIGRRTGLRRGIGTMRATREGPSVTPGASHGVYILEDAAKGGIAVGKTVMICK
jgi:hypothetical protein